MRPLSHPSVDDVSLESILHALSDPVRAAIFVEIASSGCSQNCSNFLNISARSVPKSTLSQHFRVLSEAGLIRSERHGVELRNLSRCGEIEGRFPGLIPAIINAHAVQLRAAGDGSEASAAAQSG